MSTRCQLGFYRSAEQSLDTPDAVIYQHCDGYPEGVLPTLLKWAKDFNKQRGLGDAEYAAARCLVALIIAANGLEDVIGFGISDTRQLHSDIEYYYRVDPSGVTVYHSVKFDAGFSGLKKTNHRKV